MRSTPCAAKKTDILGYLWLELKIRRKEKTKEPNEKQWSEIKNWQAAVLSLVVSFRIDIYVPTSNNCTIGFSIQAKAIQVNQLNLFQSSEPLRGLREKLCPQPLTPSELFIVLFICLFFLPFSGPAVRSQLGWRHRHIAFRRIWTRESRPCKSLGKVRRLISRGQRFHWKRLAVRWLHILA